MQSQRERSDPCQLGQSVSWARVRLGKVPVTLWSYAYRLERGRLLGCQADLNLAERRHRGLASHSGGRCPVSALSRAQ